jgi:prepilin-type N-terminal cleavage/methylation domain-containing protein
MAKKAVMEMTKTSIIGKGFTLLEIMVVMTILALASLSLPIAITQFQPNKQRKLIATNMTGELRQLRSQAMHTGLATEFSLSLISHSELPNEISISIKDVSGRDTPIIRFFPDGSSTAGSLTISNKSAISEIKILPFSGRVELQ